MPFPNVEIWMKLHQNDLLQLGDLVKCKVTTDFERMIEKFPEKFAKLIKYRSTETLVICGWCAQEKLIKDCIQVSKFTENGLFECKECYKDTKMVNEIDFTKPLICGKCKYRRELYEVCFKEGSIFCIKCNE